MTLRVLYATPFWQERSGPEESLLALLGARAFGDVEPTVALPGASPYRGRFHAAGIDTLAYPADLLRRDLDPRRQWAWATSVTRARRAAATLLASRPFDIAHSNMETTFGLALAARSAQILHVHHVRSISIARPRLAGTALIGAVRALSQAQIAISRTVAELFPSRHRPYVVENPVAPSIFVCRETGVEAAPRPRVLALGRVAPRKNLELFLEVAARVRTPADYLIVGPVEPADQAYANRLRRLANEHGLADRVHLMPPQPAREALVHADVVLNAGGNEGFCRVVAEAMAAGVPVIARSEGATREFVADGRTGLLFDDAPAGAAALERLLASPRLRESLATAAKAEAMHRFSGDTAAMSVLAIYEAVIDRRHQEQGDA